MFFVIFILSLIGFAAAIFSLVNLKKYLGYSGSISSLPGPKHKLFFGNVVDLMSDNAKLFQNMRKWSQQYYPVYSLSVVVTACANISGPEDFRLICSTNNVRKGPLYILFRLWLGGGLFTSTGSKWRSRRKMLTPAFHFSILQQFVATFNNEVDKLVEVLKKEAHKPYINVMPYIKQFTLNVISETAMGNKLNLDNEEDKIFISCCNKIGEVLYYRLMRPWLYFKALYYNLSFGGYEEKKLVKTLHQFTSKVIKEREKNFETFEVSDSEEFNYSKRKKLVMLDILLNAKLRGGQIDDEGIHDEVNTFLFAGHETSGTALSFTLMLLASHRDVQESMLEEINHVLGDTKSQPTFNDLQELKFMERCIKECLRIYPIAPLVSRILHEDVVTSNGYTLAKGTVVMVHIFDIHRDPRQWPDPEKFDPDRFLPENSQDRHPFSYVPYGAGPRNCIGQKFANLELKATLCGILRNFILEPVDTPENVVLVNDMILKTKSDTLKVKFIRRS